ncbi:MAG: nitroreductase family protein [Deltaproteobacteria bacterium]|nr:nitroreductase family protein [Deltaproteobacteria bacterium]
MDFQELLIKRRSVRNFQKKEIPIEVILEIIRETCMAPSARHSQPWKFIVINDRDMIKKLSDESKRNLLAEIAETPDSPHKIYEEALKNERFSVFWNAPCLIVIYGPKEHDFLDCDCSLAAAYLMFSATEKGLGTCWIGLGGHIENPELRKKIGLTDEDRIVAPIILGYPKNIPEPRERKEPDVAIISS